MARRSGTDRRYPGPVDGPAGICPRAGRAAVCEAAWREAAGELAARYTRVGAVRRGKLEVTVANSTLVQDLSFQKPALLEDPGRLLPDEKIEDLRFRVGPIE